MAGKLKETIHKIQRYIAVPIKLGGQLPNDGYISGVPKCVFRGGNFAGNVGAGLQALFSFNFPAKSFKSDLDSFRAILGGAFAANDDNKRIALGFGPNTVFDTGLFDIDGFGFHIEVVGVRLDPTHINLSIMALMGHSSASSAAYLPTAGSLHFCVNNNILAVTDMDTTGNALLLTGESATATNNNVIWNVGFIELTRF